MNRGILLVDDHASVRGLLNSFISHELHLEVIGEAGTGREALDLCSKLQPGLVILDLILPMLSGVEVLRQLREFRVASRVLIYSGSSNRELIADALRWRPEGFVGKGASIAILRNAINAVLDGCSYFTPSIAALLYELPRAASEASKLTPRERTILQMVSEGHSSKQIADELGLAVKTVENTRGRIMEKLNLPNTAALVRHALATGMISVA